MSHFSEFVFQKSHNAEKSLHISRINTVPRQLPSWRSITVFPVWYYRTSTSVWFYYTITPIDQTQMIEHKCVHNLSILKYQSCLFHNFMSTKIYNPSSKLVFFCLFFFCLSFCGFMLISTYFVCLFVILNWFQYHFGLYLRSQST